MAILAILKRFNFYNTTYSDMTIPDSSWFQVLIVGYKKKFTLINVAEGMGLLSCNLCLLS